MCGSRPDADAVSASAGTSAGSTPSSAATAARRSSIVATSSAFWGPRLEPAVASGSQPSPAADGRGWNHSGPEDAWPMRAEPTASSYDVVRPPSAVTSEPRRPPVEGGLGHARDGQRVDDAEQEGEHEQGAEAGEGVPAEGEQGFHDCLRFRGGGR